MIDYECDITVGNLCLSSKIFKNDVLSSIFNDRTNSLISVDLTGDTASVIETSLSVAFTHDMAAEKLSADNILYIDQTGQYNAMGGKLVNCAAGIISSDVVTKAQMDDLFSQNTSVVISTDFGIANPMVDVETGSNVSVTMKYDSESGAPKFVILT